MPNLTFIDLFAGVGGFSVGFLKAAMRGRRIFKPVGLVDKFAVAGKTFQTNFPGIPYLVQDISQLKGSELKKLPGLAGRRLDFLIGGPPCQGFTILRKNKHLDDPRNLMLADFLRLVGELKPRVVLMENVKNLYHATDGDFVEEVFIALKALGYVADAAILNAQSFGVPQIRERTFVVAYDEALGLEPPRLPSGPFAQIRDPKKLMDDDSLASVDALTQYVSVEEAIGDLPPLRAGQGTSRYTKAPFTDYQHARRRNAKILHNHQARSHSAAFLDKISQIDPGGSNRDLDDGSRFDEGRAIKYFSQAYGRLHRDGLAYTITTHFQNPGSGRFTHYRDLRAITVREAARLQSFDDDFVFLGQREDQIEMIGNAVPPLLAKALAEHFGAILLSTPELVQRQIAV